MARKVVWGIDIGQTALRAVKAADLGGRIEILGFDSVAYEEILSAPDVDRDNEIQHALRTFLSRNSVSNEEVLVSIPGQSALIKFIKLPPVEKKSIPNVVQYEAHQQIPFPLEEVVWDWRIMDKGPAAAGEQVEVGLFAMRRDIVHGFLSNLMVCDLEADVLQLAPMALHNYISYDNPGDADARLIIDMGAENTEVLISTGDSVWPRGLPISGNTLTEAIMEKFQVPFSKAETLKRMAKESKYSKQIYQCLEPVLRRLVEELRRTMGFYRGSINPGARISEILVLGGSFKLPGLAKYISDRLQIPVRSLSEPQNFDMSMARNPRAFQENPLSFGVALGLVVQGCGMASMDISLLPEELLQRKIIARKKPWAVMIATCAVLMFLVAWYHSSAMGDELKVADSEAAGKLDKAIKLNIREYEKAMDVKAVRRQLDDIRNIWDGRDFWLHAIRKILKPIPSEPENQEGVWAKKIVTERVEFDVAKTLIAKDDWEKMDSGMGLDAGGLTLDSGYLQKLKSAVARRTAFRPASFSEARRGVRKQEEVEKIKYPDVVYVVFQGETTHDDGGRYVTRTLVNELTNRWWCPCAGMVMPGLVPPDTCSSASCDLPASARVLYEGPLLVGRRPTAERGVDRFVTGSGRPLYSDSEIGDEEYITWKNIRERERQISDKTLGSWSEGDLDDKGKLPTRAKFLALLRKNKRITLKRFTEFEVVFFLDPSGKLLQAVEKEKKKLEKEGAGKTP